MPIDGAYTWTQKKDQLKVQIPLKGIAPSKVDVFVTASTLKVNYSPYIVSILLNDKIDPIKHKASVKDGVLIITLFKTNHETWSVLEATIDESSTSTKQEMIVSSRTEQELLEKELDEKRKNRRIDDERHALRKQMAIDESERTRMDTLKSEEKSSAEKEVYETFARMQADGAQAQTDKPKRVSFDSVGPDTISNEPTQESTMEKTNSKKTIWSDVDIDAYIANDDILDDEAAKSLRAHSFKPKQTHDDEEIIELNDREVKYVPQPRSQGISKESDCKVDISFTPRYFPTPARESKAQEEEDWVVKNRRHLKKHGVLGANVRKGNNVDISEEDPLWLKAKGDDFFRAGDFKSAINAYSAAIDMDPELVACFSNRSACYLALSMASDCRYDCDAALSLLITSPQPDNANENSSSYDRVTRGLKLLIERAQDSCDDDSAVTELCTVAGVAETVSLGVSDRAIYLKLIIRRGTVCCIMGLFQEAIVDFVIGLREYDCAATLAGSSPVSSSVSAVSLRADIKQLWSLAKVQHIKQQADVIFAESNLTSAMTLYTTALAINHLHVGCLSNRAACKIALGDFQGCIDDCSLALQIMELDCSTNVNNKQLQYSAQASKVNMMTSVLPPPGSEKRKSWLVKTLTRRAMAHAQLGDLASAELDFCNAVQIDPKNEALKSDLNKIKSFQKKPKNQEKQCLDSEDPDN